MRRSTIAMKRLFAGLAICVALLWSSAQARADYDAREREALEQLTKAKLPQAESEPLKKMLDTYFAARESCLEDLVELVEEDDQSRTAQGPLFQVHATNCAGQGSRIIADGLKGLGSKPSKDALLFVNVFQKDESVFLTGLMALSHAGDSRDAIVKIHVNLVGMIDVLDKDWKKEVDEDGSIDARTKQLNEAMDKDFEAELKLAAEVNRTARETLMKAARKWAENPLPDPKTGKEWVDTTISAVRAVLKIYAPRWEAKNTRVEARIRQYRQWFTSERRVLVMLTKVREQVTDFLKDNSFPDAEKAHDEGERAANDFVSEMHTSGQKDDASRMRDALVKALDAHLDGAKDTYEKFVNENEGKFFGSLNSKYKDQLLEGGTWRDYANKVRGLSLDAHIREWQEKASGLFEVDLSPIPRDKREEIRNGLRYDIENLIKEMEQAQKEYKDTQRLLEEGRKDLEDEVDY